MDRKGALISSCSPHCLRVRPGRTHPLRLERHPPQRGLPRQHISLVGRNQVPQDHRLIPHYPSCHCLSKDWTAKEVPPSPRPKAHLVPNNHLPECLLMVTPIPFQKSLNPFPGVPTIIRRSAWVHFLEKRMFGFIPT